MLKLNYNFDQAKPERSFWSRIGRPLLLFAVVGAVTGGIICLILPKQEPAAPKAPVPESVPEKKPEVPADPNAVVPWRTPDPDLQEKEEREQAAAEKARKAEEKSPAPESGEPLTDPLTPASPETENAPVVTENSGKGKVLPADPPAAQDRPVRVAVPEQEQKPDTAPAFAEAEELLKAAKFAEAADKAAKLTEACVPDSPEYVRAGGLLARANWEIVRRGLVVPGRSHAYTIRSGDSLLRIALREKTSVEQLRCSGKLTGDRIFVGRRLVIFPGPWRIEIAKNTRLLRLWNLSGGGKRLFGVYQVGIGRLNRTPSAEFVICFKEKHPAWYAPDGKVYRYGEAGNVLGDYFLKLASVQAPGRPLRGYGIHGTDDESSVGRSLSNGCIRMRNGDVGQLYTIVPTRTPVTITEGTVPGTEGEKK